MKFLLSGSVILGASSRAVDRVGILGGPRIVPGAFGSAFKAVGELSEWILSEIIGGWKNPSVVSPICRSVFAMDCGGCLEESIVGV